MTAKEFASPSPLKVKTIFEPESAGQDAFQRAAVHLLVNFLTVVLRTSSKGHATRTPCEGARRDALFYMRGLDRDHVRERIEAMELGDEAVHLGEHAVFWAKFDEKTFLKTAYHKRLLREDFYRQVTIRSGSTIEKIAALLSGD